MKLFFSQEQTLKATEAIIDFVIFSARLHRHSLFYI